MSAIEENPYTPVSLIPAKSYRVEKPLDFGWKLCGTLNVAVREILGSQNLDFMGHGLYTL